jgi:hypothetical protein
VCWAARKPAFSLAWAARNLTLRGQVSRPGACRALAQGEQARGGRGALTAGLAGGAAGAGGLAEGVGAVGLARGLPALGLAGGGGRGLAWGARGGARVAAGARGGGGAGGLALGGLALGEVLAAQLVLLPEGDVCGAGAVGDQTQKH